MRRVSKTIRKFLREHSLSLIAGTIWLFLIISSVSLFEESWYKWFSDRAGGHSDDAFGALLLVLLTKWFYERGSSESK